MALIHAKQDEADAHLHETELVLWQMWWQQGRALAAASGVDSVGPSMERPQILLVVPTTSQEPSWILVGEI